MKIKLLFSFSFIFLQFLNGQTRYNVEFILDGRLRESIIVKPSTAPPPGGYPVVYMLHGTSGDGEKFYNISGWKELGEQENFITVFPSSLSWCFVEDGIEKQNTRWVNGNVTEFPCAGPPQNYIDDVKFLKVLAKRISDTLPVNRSMIFACGFSNGCSMIHKLAVDAGDVFAAVAGASSVLAASDSSTPVKRIPIWTMVGSLDDRFIVPPFTELPFGGDSILGYLQSPMRRVIGSQGLEESFAKTESDSLHTYQFSTPKSGEVSAPYIFTLAKGMTHEFPNGTNYFFNGPARFWEFFKKSVSVGTKQTETPNLTLSFDVFPNPSEGHLQIRFNKHISKAKWKLMDLYGQTIDSGFLENGDAFKLNPNHKNSGVYFFQVASEKQWSSKKIQFCNSTQE